MFGYKAERIKELEKRVHELEEKNTELRVANIGYRAKIEKIECENTELKEELEKIKPVFETPGFKPAVSERCESCRFAYFSDYDGALLGCSKDAVCDSYEARRED